MSGSGTQQDPWVLKTPPGTSEYRMWRDEGGRSADPRLRGGLHEARLPAPLHRGPARDVEGARRLDRARERGRAEVAQGGNRRGLGPVSREPGRWLVRGQEGSARTLPGCTCRRSSRNWARQSSNTTRGTTGCARSEASRREPVGRRIEGSMGRITAAAAIGLFVLAGIMATVGFVRDARMNVLRPRRSA